MRMYVTGIKDSLRMEVFLPREAELAPDRKYPVIFLFDRQNRSNYLYNLQTIDYLTGFANMPPAVLVGIGFPSEVRTKWTLPNNAKGKADSLLAYLFGPFRKQLGKICKLAEFNLLMGHSRTAMLSSYALAAFPDQVNAVIAASNSFLILTRLPNKRCLRIISAVKIKSRDRLSIFIFLLVLMSMEMHMIHRSVN